MILQEVLNKTIHFFKEKKIETPRLDAELLISSALGMKNRVDLYVQFERPMKDPEIERCRDFVRRRSQGEPVAYILGNKGFFGNQFQVSPAVLIPRPETELLVEKAVEFIESNKIENPRILDLGTGTGCIGISLAKKFPTASVTLVEASKEAADIANANADQLGVRSQVKIVHQNVENCTFDSSFFDVILSNPPYIASDDLNVDESVKKFEPHLALYSEDSGFQALKTWSKKSSGWLKPVGLMGFEFGATQGTEMKAYFESLNIFASVQIIKDYAGLDRHVLGVRHG